MFRWRKPDFLVAACLLALPLSLCAKDGVCNLKMCSEDYTQPRCFRALCDKKDVLTFMRSNPGGSLECFKQQAMVAKERPISDLLLDKRFWGVIGGDVKPDNVDIVLVEANDDWQIGLIDLDDGGQGPLFGDVFHTLTYNSVWSPSIPLTEAIAAYRAGLKGDELKGVPTLKDILGDKRQRERSCKDLEKDSDKDNKGPGKLKDLKYAPKAVRELYDGKTFDNTLQQLYRKEKNDPSNSVKITFKGYERKESSGGSMCAPRFVYMIQVKNSKHDKGDLCQIVQFKHQPGAAAAAFDSGPADHKSRVTRVVEHYRPLDRQGKERDAGSFIGVVKGAKNEYYIARYDRPEQFKIKKDTNPDDVKAYTKRMLYWLGRTHAQQNEAYAAEFERAMEKPGVLEELDKMIREHVEYLTELSNKHDGPPFKCPD